MNARWTAEQQVGVFGCTEAEIDDAVRQEIDRGGDRLMLAASILSDAQEILARGRAETARQFINRAKKIIFDVRRLMREEA